jgi:hypothetical protein
MGAAGNNANVASTGAQRIVAVIPHWNRRELLEQLLTNLAKQSRAFNEVIVIDNGSTDGSAELAEQLGAKVVRLDRNMGFAVAVNRGIEAAIQNKAEFVAILNNDVTLDPTWLGALLAAIQLQDEAGQSYWFATGKILAAADRARGIATIDGTWDEVSAAACPLRCGAGQPDGPFWNSRRTIRMASMTAVLMRTELFEKVGVLDERFGSYLEDVDFGLRCAVAGLLGVYQPEAVCAHLGSSTLGRWNPDTVRWLSRNQVLLAAKHFRGLPNKFAVATRLLWGQGLWGLVCLKHGCGVAYLTGKLSGLREVKSMQPVSDLERERVAAFLQIIRSSEQEIFEIQKLTGFDRYWKTYFWFRGAGSK